MRKRSFANNFLERDLVKVPHNKASPLVPVTIVRYGIPRTLKIYGAITKDGEALVTSGNMNFYEGDLIVIFDDMPSNFYLWPQEKEM